jgi:hypothetical protein
VKNASNTEPLYLANEAMLRAEHFGGLVFDRRNGAMLEVDRQGFELLLQARTAGIYPDDPENSASFIDRLLQLRILEKGDCRLLYGIWLEYGDQEDDESAPPEIEMTKLPASIKKLLSLLEQV